MGPGFDLMMVVLVMAERTMQRMVNPSGTDTFMKWCAERDLPLITPHRYETALHHKPDTLEELKQVLNTVNIIRNEGMAMELRCGLV